MLSRSTLLHLRIPFSFFLLPVYLFALAISPNLNGARLFWSFFIIHFLLYPASNAYNSYFDKDEKSIGGLRNPPPVKKELYWAALTLDALAIVLGFLKISLLFALMLFIYGVASKAYSHPSIRLKKYPFVSWLIAGFFQGCFSFLMSYAAINKFETESLVREPVLVAGVLTSVMLWASYPMTQIYQHEEDAKHGDKTLSMVLSVRGTFLFAMLFFSLSSLGFFYYFSTYQNIKTGLIFLASLAPVVAFFLFWFSRVINDASKANFSYTMWLNFISSFCLNGFFIWLWLDTSHILQL